MDDRCLHSAIQAAVIVEAALRSEQSAKQVCNDESYNEDRMSSYCIFLPARYTNG